MKKVGIKKKARWDDRGVSEVVGTILILAITVVLFSVIIIWVGSFEAPEASVRIKMHGKLQPIMVGAVWNGVSINITHEGGEALEGFKTRVLLYITHVDTSSDEDLLKLNGVTLEGNPYGLEKIDDVWNAGDTWTYVNYSIVSSDTVEAFVLDYSEGQVLWNSVLLGGELEHYPFFVEKWVDAWPQTIFTRDVLEDDDLTFAVYARIDDKDGDLDPAKIYLLLTWLEIETRMYDNGGHGDRIADDGIFSYDFVQYKTDTGKDFPGVELSWDGGIILFNATDKANHTTQARMNLVVTLSEATEQALELHQNLTLPPGGPGNLSFGNRLQRFDVFNYTEWQSRRWVANSTREFVKGEIAVVLVASKTLEASDEENTLLLYDSSGDPVTYCAASPGPSTTPSSTDAFIFLDAVGKWTVFIYYFNTTSEAVGCDDGQLAYGRYPMEVTIRDTYGNRFHTVDRINVTDEDGNIPVFPDMLTFCDATHLIPCREFNFTDTVYVKIIVETAQDSGFDIGDVIIEDYVGGKQVWAPPGVTPVSDAEKNTSGEIYKFSIDLSKPNVDPWLYGDNYYGFWVRSLVDDDEEYILALSMQIKVNGPRWSLDIATVVEEFAHPTHDKKYYAFFYDNVAPLFPRYSIQEFEPFPSQKEPPWGGGAFLSVVMSDLDLDQDLDVAVGIEAGHVYWYRNIAGSGQLWLRYDIDFLDSPVNGIDAGDVDDDRDPDIVAGAGNGQIWWYKNGAAWSPTLVDSIGASVNAVKLADVIGDDLPDLVVACSDNKIRVYRNNNGTFGNAVPYPEYTIDPETTNIGAIVSGTHTNTHSSDNNYEILREGTGDAYITTIYNATAELPPLVGAQTGTYLNTHADDGVYEVLEEESDGGGGVNERYIYRDAWNDPDSGQEYDMGTVTVQAGDTVSLVITGFITPDSGVDTEAFQIGYYDTAFHWIGTFSSTTESTTSYDISAFTGGQLYVYINDRDTSKNPPDDATDGILTSFKIDQLYVEVNHQSGQTSRLDHVWRFDVDGGGDAYKFYVEAYRPSNSEGDDFLFQYSIGSAAGPWYDLVTVSKALDDNRAQAASMPTAVGGNEVFVRVIDTDGTINNLNNDTISVDLLRIDKIVVYPNVKEITVGAVVNDVAVGDIDEDGTNDIVCGYAATPFVRVYYGPADWTVVDGLTATANALSVDIGYIDGDDYLDVVAGTTDNSVYTFVNGQVRGSWTRSLVDTAAGDIMTVRVGDVDGDYWDDIVYGSTMQEIVFLRHPKGQYWEAHDVNLDPELVTTYWDIDVGDADRGITLDPVRADRV